MRQRCVVNTMLLALLLALSAGIGRAHNPEAGPDPDPPTNGLGPTFTYQGRLLDTGGSPLSGSFDFRFTLCDSDGAAVSPTTNLVEDYEVVDGLVTVHLAFGEYDFNGEARYLQIEVREGDGGAFTLLQPRQQLTAAPYALYAARAPWSGLDGMPAEFANGAWSLTGNAGTSTDVHFLGTTDDRALEVRVNNSRVLRLEPNATSPNVIGGHSSNSVSGFRLGGTVSGGGRSDRPNQVTADYGTVGGGRGNTASGDTATVSGGRSNSAGSGGGTTVGGGGLNAAVSHYATVAGGYDGMASASYSAVGGGEGNRASRDYATVGGGNHNVASGWAGTIGGGDQNVITGTTPHGYATIGGGRYNEATGQFAAIGGGGGNIREYGNAVRADYGTVGGGSTNLVVGAFGTVPGGDNNTAWGSYSFAAGRKSYAGHDGSFVFSSDVIGTNSWGDHTFTVRAHGGTRFYSAVGVGTGVQLTAGGSSWGSISDRNAKENFAAVDQQQLLSALATMPVQTWNLKSQRPELRHIGPVAQDFNGAFAYLFGEEVEDPVRINTMDAVGVSLAAAQGLHQLSQEHATHIETLRAENASLARQVDELETRLAALEGTIEDSRPSGRWPSAILPGTGFLLVSLGLITVVRGRGLRATAADRGLKQPIE